MWAFGAVLYEMLTGRRAFEGEDVSDTLANVLKSEPDWNALPADVPPHIRHVDPALPREGSTATDGRHVGRAVRDDRAGESRACRRLWLPAADERCRATAAVAPPRDAGGCRHRGRCRGWHGRLARDASERALASRVLRSLQQVRRRCPWTLRSSRPHDHAGRHAHRLQRGRNDRHATLRARPRSTRADAARGPRHAARPVLLAGWAMDRLRRRHGIPVTLKKVAITGGPALPLCRLDGASRGATWGDDDSIIFATAAPSTGLQRVSSAGGEPTVLTKPNRERGEADHLWPQFLPGSQAVLFTITATTGGIDASQVAVLDLRTGTQKILLRGGSQAQYVPSGHLVYVAAGTLRAVAFDLERLESDRHGDSGGAAGRDAADRHGRVRRRPLTARWCTCPVALARACADARVGRSPGSGRSDQGGAGPRLYVSAAVTGWDARGARHPRSGERYLGLGLCPRDAHAGHVRSGVRPGAGVDARWTPPGVQLSSWWARRGRSSGRRPTGRALRSV